MSGDDQPILVDRDGDEWHWVNGAYHSTSSGCHRDEIARVWGPLTEKAPPGESDWARQMRSYLGTWVEVTLSRDPEVTQAGVLFGFTDDGSVHLRDDDGTDRWCWPNLACHPSTRPWTS